VGTNVFLRNRGRSCWGALEESGSAPSSNTLVFALAVRVDLIIHSFEVFKLAPLPGPGSHAPDAPSHRPHAYQCSQAQQQLQQSAAGAILLERKPDDTHVVHPCPPTRKLKAHAHAHAHAHV
jgi:hypothetical protein